MSTVNYSEGPNQPKAENHPTKPTVVDERTNFPDDSWSRNTKHYRV